MEGFGEDDDYAGRWEELVIAVCVFGDVLGLPVTPAEDDDACWFVGGTGTGFFVAIAEVDSI